jgi:radical SAM superfamily enzyme YgiQ (UPF0313 family)
MMPQLALHILDGLTPAEHEVHIIEEEIEDIDLNYDCDLVGITCMTSNAPRAYQFGDEFKKRGKQVVLGGVHPTILPDEAIQHADAVVVGEAEGVWNEVLSDAGRRQLKQRYHNPLPDLANYYRIKGRADMKRRMFNIIPVMTTRGCPYACEFCCVHSIYGSKVRHIPVANVIRDMEDSLGRFFMILDDNVIGDKMYAVELFGAIKPLGIRWVGQASISFVHDERMMKLAADSGCIGLFFGLESVTESQIKKMRKSLHDLKEVEEAVKKIQDYGIHFHASMVFGFDDDTRDVFKETVDFLCRNRISTASLNVLTPYPGTAVYNQFVREGRLISTNWKYYDHNTVVFKPRNMSAIELQEGKIQAIREYTKLTSTFKRLIYHLDRPHYHLALNIASLRSVKKEIRQFPALAQELYA